MTGAQIVGRAFVRAVRQELQASQAAARARSGAPGTSSATAGEAAKDAVTGMTVQVSCQVYVLDCMRHLQLHLTNIISQELVLFFLIFVENIFRFV